jgi:hypothetical protein
LTEEELAVSVADAYKFEEIPDMAGRLHRLAPPAMSSSR